MPRAEINYDTEMNFAREFYKKAVKGLDPKEYPPFPDQWILSPEYKQGWEASKVEMIGMLESEEPVITEEQREQLEMFLRCDLCIYLDLMSTIYQEFIEKKEKQEDLEYQLDQEMKELEESICESDNTNPDEEKDPVNSEPIISTEQVDQEEVVISTKGEDSEH